MTDIQLGVIVNLGAGPEAAIAHASDFGFPTCQVSCWDEALYTDDTARRLRAAADARGVAITTLWAGWPGPRVWNLVEGPETIGLVPPAHRAARVAALKRGADFARATGIASITTHVGFIPEHPRDPLYTGVVAALTEVAEYCRRQGLGFWFETGQETPVTLLRTMQDIGTDNLGVNLDPANLLLYGKANPVDALDTIGAYVRGVHAKDGEYPTDGRHLGKEKPLGQGRVNFPTLLKTLHGLGFRGALTIEREISGPQQAADIRQGKAFLEGILAAL